MCGRFTDQLPWSEQRALMSLIGAPLSLRPRYEAVARQATDVVRASVCAGHAKALRSAVAKLRRKLGDDAQKSRYVIGVRGLGYRMPVPDGA